MKINSCFLFVLLLLSVAYSLAVETSQPETMNEKVKGPEDASKVGAYGGGGGGNYGGGGGNYGGGGGNWGGGGGNRGGGGGGGYGCRHGCCYRGYYRGGCPNCCHSPEEAKGFAEQLHP